MNLKLLIFIDWYKPGFKAGGPIRSISNLVNYLSDKLDIYIITRDTDYLETIPYSTIKSDQWNVIDGANVFYLSNENQNYKTIKKLIREIKPKIIYCNSLYSPIFTLIPIYLANHLNIKPILAIRGMLSSGSLSVKSPKKKFFLFLIKNLRLFRKCTFHATTTDEKVAIQKAFGKDKSIIIAQNLPENKNILFQEKPKEVNQLKMVSVGRISPEKNTLFALEILKEVKSNIIFDIYGPIYNQEYWDKCKTIINQIPHNIVVNYKGILPHHQLDEILKEYHIFYSPSTGENFGHSIIEGMINSCIPVISDKTPWRNLEEKNIGFDISLTDSKFFSERIDSLANLSKEEFNKISLNTYNYAHQFINDSESLKKYLTLFEL